MIPWKIVRDVVRRNRESKRTALGIAFGHNLYESTIYHVHFVLQIAVCKVNLLFTNKRTLRFQIFGASPIERKVDERRLCSPTAWHRAVEHQCLHRVFYIGIGHIINADIRRKVCVNRRKRLGPRKFVLQRPKEIHHVRYRGCHVARRFTLQITRNTVESLVQQFAQ